MEKWLTKSTVLWCWIEVWTIMMTLQRFCLRMEAEKCDSLRAEDRQVMRALMRVLRTSETFWRSVRLGWEPVKFRLGLSRLLRVWKVLFHLSRLCSKQLPRLVRRTTSQCSQKFRLLSTFWTTQAPLSQLYLIQSSLWESLIIRFTRASTQERDLWPQ